MKFFTVKKTIPFMRFAMYFNIASIIIFITASYFLFYKGLHYSIEFTGGIDVEMTFSKAPDIEAVRQRVEIAGFKDVPVQQFGSADVVLVRLPSQPEGKTGAVVDNVVNEIKKIDESTKVNRIEYVGPQVGKELASDGLFALLFVVIGIILYLAFRFEWRLATASVIANLHDVLVVMGIFAFFGWEFSLPVLAGTLAVLGYSVNESVIIFDRVRENFRTMRTASVVEIMDSAITKNISRTIITHGSTQCVVVTMLLFGGPTLHNFALALTIGIWFGIYSAIFISCPLAMYLGTDRLQFIKTPRDKNQHPDGAVV